MRRYAGVDYLRGYSYMTVMDETGKIYGQGQVNNQPEAIREFPTRFGVNGNGAAVLEARIMVVSRYPHTSMWYPALRVSIGYRLLSV